MVTQKVSDDCSGRSNMYPLVNGFYGGVASPMASQTSNAPTTSYGSANAPGIGGSTARFTVASNTLYIVDNSTLHVYDVTATSAPQHVNDQNPSGLFGNIETIFPYNGRLFLGSNSGVYIYDISSPQNPVFISEYSHITACDPVVVDSHYAYFTLSSDAPCHMGVNELDVVDISNIQSPTLVTTIPMTNPKGLGVDAQTLFVCDAQAGLKVYNTSNISNLQNSMVAQFSKINSFDVIPYNKHLIMTGSNGVYQYDYSNLQNITLISTIPVSGN